VSLNNDLAINASLSNVKVVIFDVDGVLTDGKVIVDAQGGESLRFDIQDGLGFYRGYRYGLQYAIITGRDTPAVAARAAQLRIEQIYQGQVNKQEAYEMVKKAYGVTDDEVAYMGDDVNDLPVMQQVGFACAVANARPEIRTLAHLVTHARGGDGAVREFLERIIAAKEGENGS